MARPPAPTEVFYDPSKEAQEVSDEGKDQVLSDEARFDQHGVPYSEAKVAQGIAAAHLGGRSKGAIKVYMSLLVAFMASVQNGFDGSIMSNINAMHQYLDYFHYEQSGASTGFVFISYQIGNIIGACFAGWICDHFGRRGGMTIYAAIVLVSAALSAASQNPAWFVATRIILGIGISLATTAAPVYATELAPPAWRGRCVGAYNSCYTVGSLTVSGLMVGTVYIENTAAWRIPLALQCVPAIIVLCTVWFIPESPRWLAAKGRIKEAEDVFTELHGDGDRESPLVKLQMIEIEESLAQTKATKALRWYDFGCLFNSREARWRTLQVTMMCFAGQWTGNGIGYFFPVMYAGAGVTSQKMQLVLHFVSSITSFLAAVVGSAYTDRIGRRPRLIWGTLSIALMMVALFALTHVFGQGGPKYDPDHPEGANAGIFFLFLQGIAFSAIYTPLQSLFCSECLTTGTRAKGMAYHTLVVNVALLVNTFGISVALKEIDNYVYLIYAGWCLLETAMWYFLCVETRGRTLEELDAVFRSPNPIKASKIAATDAHD